MDVITSRIRIRHTPSTRGAHVVEDYLSRLELGKEGIEVKDDFPDGQLFHVDTIPVEEMKDDKADAWITEMTIYLTTGLLP
mgnify:CR=1 FL=1